MTWKHDSWPKLFPNLNGTTLLRFTPHHLRILQSPAFLQHTSNVKACRIIRQCKANRVINHMQLSVAIFCHRINHLAIIIPLFTHNCLDYLLSKNHPATICNYDFFRLTWGLSYLTHMNSPFFFAMFEGFASLLPKTKVAGLQQFGLKSWSETETQNTWGNRWESRRLRAVFVS